MTGELAKIGAGYELPFFFVYTDNDGAGGNTYIRTDVTTGCSWVAEEMGSIALVLQEPKTTGTSAAADETASAATADPTAALLIISALASGACNVSQKEKVNKIQPSFFGFSAQTSGLIGALNPYFFRQKQY